MNRVIRGKMGRPTRKPASEKAMTALSDQGVDWRDVDPREVLQRIAADDSAPASARVQAARILLTDNPGDAGKTGDDVKPKPMSAASRRAVVMLADARKRSGGNR
jgi:hypothetical protein